MLNVFNYELFKEKLLPPHFNNNFRDKSSWERSNLFTTDMNYRLLHNYEKKAMEGNIPVYKDVINPVETNKTDFSAGKGLYFSFVISLL